MVEHGDGGTGTTSGEHPKDERDDPISRFAPHLREEFETLRRSDRQIVKALADPEVAGRFSADPARTLEEIGVKVPPALKARLASTRPSPLPTEQRFRLPNGQVVTARVKVRFTDGKRG
jgi:hypothetical protein